MESSVQKNLCAGLLAHVDSGKTTLTEAMLYRSGALRRAGRVDHGDAFLDHHALERSRGITIFAKEARLTQPVAKGCYSSKSRPARSAITSWTKSEAATCSGWLL